LSLEDRFDIESPLYIGQVATAYPAQQKGLDRKVLLKVLHQHWIEDEELVERFIREGKAVAGIDHPNVVRVYECGREDNVPYLALEWIEGETLADKMAAGPLPQEEVERIATGILQGLSAVHAQGLLHRDLKPDNILISKDGRIVLADFSLAGFETLPGLTGHGAIVGSPAYMAPEIVEGKPASGRSDLFGVGVMLLEALTGYNPFAADDPLVSLDKIRNVDPPRLTGREQFKRELATLVDALLARDPDARPDDPAAAISILEGKQPELKIDRKPVRLIPWFAAGAILLLFVILLIQSDYDSGSVDKGSAVEDTLLDQIADTPAIVQAESTVVSTIVDTVPLIESSLPVSQDFTEVIESPEPARLTIIARPWANITIDGEDAGVTPLGTLELPAGQHEIVFRHESYPFIHREVDLKAGLLDTLAVDFMVENARISLSAKPWGYLWLNGDSIGLLPRKDPVWLPPGRHLIEIRHPEFKTWQAPLDVKAGDHSNLRIDLKSGTMIATDVGGI